MSIGRAWDRSPFSTSAGGPVLPLDIILGSIAAYSLRKIRTGYAGPAVNIRRSSDSLTQDIGFAGIDFDVAGFNTWVGGGTGFVATWYDQTGGGHHAVQGTGTNQPQIALAATSTGKPTVSSASGTISLAATIPTSTYPLSLNSVTQRTGNLTAFNVSVSLGNAQPGIFYQNSADGGIGLANINSAILASVSALDALFHVSIGTRIAGGGGSIIVDGTAASGSLADAAGSTSLYLFDPAVTAGLVGSMCEAMYFGVSLAAGDLITLRADQKAYWGTP